MNKTTQQLNFTRYTNAPGQPYATVELLHSRSNCKFSQIDFISHILGSGTDAQKKERMLEVLKDARILVLVNTSIEAQKNWLEANFEIYESVKIPIGYGGGYQYHIFIRNPHGVQNPNMRPTEFKKDKEVPKGTVTKEKVKTELEKLLKQKRRKTDLVNEFVESL